MDSKMSRLKVIVSIGFAVFAAALFLKDRTVSAVPVAFLAPPRSVSATDGDHIDKVTLWWNAVRGASQYRVLRSTTNDPQTANDLGTTASGYYFDFTATVGQDYYYWVRAENASAVSLLSAPDHGLRASGSFHSAIFSPLSSPPNPSANGVTAAKAMLGKTLFWDEQLSSTRTVACGTCHRPASGGSDPRTTVGSERAKNPGFDGVFDTEDDIFGSPGVIQNNGNGGLVPSSVFGLKEQTTSRKAPSYLNAGITTNGTFWDGRATNTFRDPLTNSTLFTDWGGLESQSLAPPVSTAEMGHNGRDWTQVAARVAASKPLALASKIPRSMLNWINGRDYPQLFEEAFGTPEVTPVRIAMAIATHERTLFSDRSPLDRWAMQIEELAPDESRGRDLFATLNCTFCHGGPALSDQNFNNVGVRPTNEDRGRGAFTGNSSDNGRFKSPSLRNVELRGPYFHNGRFATLEDVVEFYNRGGDFDAPNINRGLVRPLNLTAGQKADLVAFLRRPLTDPRVRDELPPFDRPRLFTDSPLVPALIGSGREGTGGIVPTAVALEPPVAGNATFTIGLSDALPASTVVLVIDDADPGVGTSIPAAGTLIRHSTVTDAGGFASASLALDPGLAGRTFFGRWYVTDAGAASGISVTPLIRFTVFAPAASVARQPNCDFDGDGRSDVSIFRPSNGQWWISRSGDGGNFAAQFGIETDRIVPADFTGDGRSDIAVWRGGTWFVLRSEDFSYYSFPFGTSGDVPVPADFDGDARSDAAVFRASNSTWYVSLSNGGMLIEQFGATGDRPYAGDFDGDGRSDLAIFRPSTGDWWLRQSSAGISAFHFGNSDDVPVPADYTGDGRADAAVWRPSTGEWFVLRSEDGSYYSFGFGAAGDIPSPGDFDGDGLADAAVFRPAAGTWYASRSNSGLMITQFGLGGDRPAPAAYYP